jgi:glutamate synthase (NADPH/NADH) small chain
MGKTTGFLEFERAAAASRSPRERIQDFQEFHTPLSHARQRQQAARCMDCGVPGCQYGRPLEGRTVGCPLHSLIPEYQDALYRGLEDLALARLLKNNLFPEFTGRVCPALCEKACTCGLYQEAVSCRENELAIAEGGFARGAVKPHVPPLRSGLAAAIIGSGPSGLAAAEQLNRCGYTVDVYETSDRCGGLLMYGIPNMKLDKEIVARRLRLMEQEGIRFHADARINDPRLLNGPDAVVLCCGSTMPRAVKVPGIDAEGVLYAVDFLTRVTRGLLEEDLDAVRALVQDQEVVIIGGGDTGNDCTGSVIRLGAAGVTQLEMMPEPPRERRADNPWPLWPNVLKTDYGQEEAIAVYGHDPRRYSTTVQEVTADAAGHVQAVKTVRTQWQDHAMRLVPGSEQTLPCGLLLIAAGFSGIAPELAQRFALPVVKNRIVPPDAGNPWRIREGLYMAGDLRTGQSLVVSAEADGIACAQAVVKDARQSGH